MRPDFVAWAKAQQALWHARYAVGMARGDIDPLTPRVDPRWRAEGPHLIYEEVPPLPRVTSDLSQHPDRLRCNCPDCWNARVVVLFETSSGTLKVEFAEGEDEPREQLLRRFDTLTVAYLTAIVDQQVNA